MPQEGKGEKICVFWETTSHRLHLIKKGKSEKVKKNQNFLEGHRV